MNKIAFLKVSLCRFALMTVLLTLCSFIIKNKPANKNEVVIHALSDPEGFNPYTTSDAQATHIMRNIFQTLLNYNMSENSELVPVLAKSRPEIKVLPNKDGMELTYEIKEDAVWDNGDPITAEDVVFSYKALFCPGVNSESNKSSLEFVSDIRTYTDNPKKFTIISNKVYAMAEDATGVDVFIIPTYFYDSKNLLKDFNVSDFFNNSKKINTNSKVIEFAKQFNSTQYSHVSDNVVGSGAYKLESWKLGQKVVLTKKDNWWGKRHEVENLYFEAYPIKLTYLVINDFSTAIQALKEQKLDVIYVTPVKEFIDIEKSAKYKENFEKSEPPMPVYTYIGLNTRDKILKDIKVRQALSILIDVDYITYETGKRIVADIDLNNIEDYNSDIELYPHDIEKAKSFLAEAGWKDTDGDNILDKKINGEKTPFKLIYNYNSGNQHRENVGLLLQKWFKEVGIRIEILPLDWSVYLDELKKQKVQIWYGSWIHDPRDNDLSYIWHTESRNGGSNYTAFGNAESDKLIEQINMELDPAKRSELYKQWQVLLHNEAPYIFLYTQPYRNIIHNRFENLHEGINYPGFWEAGFKLKDDDK